MTESALSFVSSFGAMMWRALNNVVIPGTSWSVLGLFLGIFLMGLVIKILSGFFSGFSISGVFSSIKEHKAESARQATRERMNKARIIHFKQEMHTRHVIKNRKE